MTVRDLVIQERTAYPCATLQQIADKYGITKERVRQILASANLATRHRKPGYICNNCGGTYYPIDNWLITPQAPNSFL